MLTNRLAVSIQDNSLHLVIIEKVNSKRTVNLNSNTMAKPVFEPEIRYNHPPPARPGDTTNEQE
jgi:hypothetical protein